MRKSLIALALAAAMGHATAAEPFQVEDIRVEGLRRIAAGTVFNYLPIQVGDRVDDARIASAIRSLYDTGFFQDIALRRDGDTLVVEVSERPAIARIELHGNDEIGEEDLLKGLKDAGLAQGRTFDRSLLAQVERQLRQQYFALGYYDVRVESTVSPLPRNRVGVRLDITEGEPASVQAIEFVGNQSFDDEALRDQFEMGPVPWWSFFSDADRYSRQRLAGDLERLRSFYQDRGFVNFTITSTQVSISPDRRRIHVTVNLDEGEQFRVGEISLAGDLVFPEETMRELVAVAPDGLYSRQDVVATSEAFREKLGERGYAFANVNPLPEVNEDEGTVDLTFFVDPAERVYVRRINISGNTRTRDDVIRQELRQSEGAWLSTADVEESRRRLGRLGFFDNVNIETPRVPGTGDQVDVDVSVEERLSGSLKAGIGYGTEQGLLLNFGVQQDNVLGSGDRLSFTANNDDVNTVYRASYLDRFYTRSGIDRDMSVAFRDTDADEADLSDYGVKSLTGTYGYRIPVTSNDTFGVDVEIEDLELTLSDEPTEVQTDFVERNGESNMTYRLALSWTHDTRDRAVFPTSGSRQRGSLQVSIPGSDLEYYRASYSHRRFAAISDWLTLALEGSLAYGDGFGSTGRLPFFENYFAGGISTVRGYDGNSLGPRDENDDPLGGNFRALGSAELRFPPPGAEDSGFRISTFVDAGQVWSTPDQDIDAGEIRYAAGLGVIWMSPLGPLTMSVAEPLNDEPGDDTQFFQFSVGTFF
ncbi:outer membrane protein assembly factor BamA [Arhodomonas sp. AD133]|uniref:outer membrane protein assembly factor BamA n=1 Tax=Arhodomonas sp. AD133 TaxID=3415009 RepID=UPI003EBD9F2A